jgi:DNA-binding IclR family transcriptional regulator
LNAFLDDVDFVKYTENTITSKKAFKRELRGIRKSKIAMAFEERGKGVWAMGSPVFNSEGGLCAVIGIIIRGGQPVKPELERLKRLLSETADAASFAMGYPHWKSHSYGQD